MFGKFNTVHTIYNNFEFSQSFLTSTIEKKAHVARMLNINFRMVLQYSWNFKITQVVYSPLKNNLV